MPDDELPAIAEEVASLLAAKGWTVRRLRDEKGFGTPAAMKLLGSGKGLPSVDSLNRALGILGKELWHRRKRKGGH